MSPASATMVMESTTRNSEGTQVILMERHPHTTLDDGLIALIVKNIDHQVTIRGGSIHNHIEPVDLIVDVTINLAKGTMKFLFASKVSYDVEYTFTHLEADKVVTLLTSSQVLFFGARDTIMAQLEHGEFNRTLIYSEKADLRRVHRVTTLRH